MKLPALILLLLFVTQSCHENEASAIRDQNHTPANLISLFETDLAKLDKSSLKSLDKATSLFKDYHAKTVNIHQVDSLFQPYFNFYNSGRNILIGKSDSLVKAYGFSRTISNGKESIFPEYSDYLRTNILAHLSEPMRAFTTQQLREFNDPGTLKSRAANTIWWEHFNRNNPDFFMSAMSEYHYTNWHLNKLLNGSTQARVFDEQGTLAPEAKDVYTSIINDYPKSGTSNILTQYLALLKKSQGRKSAEVEDFLKRYRPQ